VLCLFVCWWASGAPQCAFWLCKSCRKARFSHHHFNGFWCPQKKQIFTRTESMYPPLLLIQHDTVRNLQKSDPNQTSRALQETKTIRDKHPNQPHMKVGVRPERGAEMQSEFIRIRNELWGVQPCSRVNFTEGPKWKQKSHTHTGAGQIPISSLHMLSTNVNLELMKRSWSQLYWFWDSLKGINPCLTEIKQSHFPSAEPSQLKLTDWVGIRTLY